MHDGIERAKDAELLNCKSGAEYLLSKLRTAAQNAKTTHDLWKKQSHADDGNPIRSSLLIQFILLLSASTLPFLNECIALANNMTDVVIHGKATSNLVQDVDQSAILADLCRDVTLQCIDIYTNYQTRSYCKFHPLIVKTIFIVLASDSIDADKLSNEFIRRLNSLIEKTTILLPKVSDISKEELGDLVEKELQSTHETIDEAVRQLEV